MTKLREKQKTKKTKNTRGPHKDIGRDRERDGKAR
jgi:hypothetical protein